MGRHRANFLIIALVLVMLLILETSKVNDFSSLASQESTNEEHFQPHTRHKRNVPLNLVDYEVAVELNVSDVATLNLLKSQLSNGTFSITLNNIVNITSINITTVCSLSSAGFQCRCEDRYRWSCDQCQRLGSCDNIINDTCGCINTIPPDGLYCQPVALSDFTACSPTTVISILPSAAVNDYIMSIELNISDVTVINQLRTILSNFSFPVNISNQVQIYGINITTVCSQTNSGFQCTCEDQYRWSCEQCLSLGSCDNITGNTCGCINSMPPDGLYCQPVHQNSFTSCPVTIPPPTLTPPAAAYEYIFSIELNVSDVAVINQLRTILSNFSSPVNISNQVQIYGINITTVCSQTNSGFQCTCEDQYRWSCEQCLSLGSCDNITGNTCGCINSMPPDGLYCQPVYQNSFTSCPVTTPPPTLAPPAAAYEYIFSIELNVSDIAVINQLRTILSNFSSPVNISNQVQIYGINITTVCSQSNSGFQCTCEDQYRWSCEQCLSLGSCDNITGNTCGCINSMPPDGLYCQPVYQNSFTSCPVTTPPPTLIYAAMTMDPTSSITNAGNTTTIMGPSSPITSKTAGAITTSNPSISTTTITTATSVSNQSSAVSSPTSDSSSTTASTTNVQTTTKTMTNNPIPPTTTAIADTTINTVITTVAYTVNSIPNTTTTTNDTTNATISTRTPITTNSTTIPITTPTTNSTTTSATTTASALVTISSTADTINSTTIPITTPTTNSTTTSTTTTASALVTISSTADTTTPQMTTSTTTTTSSTPRQDIFDVKMEVELNYTYTSDLNDSNSSNYNKLRQKILNVLQMQYKGITGYEGVSVKGFRQGSVIVDYVVQTTQIIAVEIATANQKLPEAMASVAPVLGSVSAVYNSSTSISLSPSLIYTGNIMTLTCGPLNINVSAATWTFQGVQIKNHGRFNITTTSTLSDLTISNVITSDIGTYTCTMIGSAMTFFQSGVVTADQVQEAPNLKLQGEVNVEYSKGVDLQCCVQQNFTVHWYEGKTHLKMVSNRNAQSYCIIYSFPPNSNSGSYTFTCEVDNPPGYNQTTTVKVFMGDVKCNNSQFGVGQEGDTAVTYACDQGQEGSMSAVCESTGMWKVMSDNCIITIIKNLNIESQNVGTEQVPAFVKSLYEAVQQNQMEIWNSSWSISTIVDILNTIAIVPTPVNQTVMEDVLNTVNAIVGENTTESWKLLNENMSSNASSVLLSSLESYSDSLNEDFTVVTPLIVLERKKFNNTFNAILNSSVTIDIPNTNLTDKTVTTMIFFSLNKVMPTRNSTTGNRTTSNFINADVVLIKINATIQNVILRYVKLNNASTLNTSLSLNNSLPLNNSVTLSPHCVFWNFKLFSNFGAWDDTGCNFVSDINNIVTCNCNHLTSFSILMAPGIPESDSIRRALAIITYIGVGISLASLVICLIIEGYVWKAITRNSTAFMRHVSIVNTALSLLVANICFIIGASISKNPAEDQWQNYDVPVGACSTATFFMHFFYLALFFWMLVSGLLLLYRTVMVFSHMSKSTMLAIGFSLGYGCPLIIAVITVAATAPGHGYIRKDYACWLNWTETKALLAMVIPALTIVSINFLIVILVLLKMLRRGVGDTFKREEKQTLVVVTRCVIILTPLFGLTWSLGVGTMISYTDEGTHIAFALFNSLQGFFILVFGTLYDSKIRSLLSRRYLTPSMGCCPTKSTSGGDTSSRGFNILNHFRRRKNIYHVSEAANQSNSHTSESYVII
ncbi:adhesion G protein-coupled receptor F5-like isoform X2 [Betta splendens]|uniref:Adhesion G protein-coupled receptor F5-like isoform X2 n=1 Tax=Betta splendens TaxID=158456 RepID=A0A9W2XL07_BETSP|nr:adhesion G protein-coupled receptor F5-like isoform X2 [Betta splendens]